MTAFTPDLPSDYYLLLDDLPFDLPPSPPPSSQDLLPSSFGPDEAMSTLYATIAAKPPPQPRRRSSLSNKNSTYNNVHLTCTIHKEETLLNTMPPPLKQKKHVHFQSYITSIDLPISSSNMSQKEKQDVWYAPTDFDQFKLNAAENAGVKVLRYNETKTQEGSSGKDLQPHRNAQRQVVMVGNFDKDNAANGNDAIPNIGKAGSIASINQKEYMDDEKRQICKRGLGYHFSRIRKRDKALARSAVLAFQTTIQNRLGKPNLAVSLSTGEDGAKAEDAQKVNHVKFNQDQTRPPPPFDRKSQLILALISNKCTKNARETAEWRGRVDYMMAYPERHPVSSPAVHHPYQHPNHHAFQQKQNHNFHYDESIMNLDQSRLESMSFATGALLSQPHNVNSFALSKKTQRKRYREAEGRTDAPCANTMPSHYTSNTIASHEGSQGQAQRCTIIQEAMPQF